MPEAIEFSKHALEEMAIRDIPFDLVKRVVENPQQTYMQDEQIKVYQSQVLFENGLTYLIRVFVNVIKTPNLVVTAYKTSKISKYWL